MTVSTLLNSMDSHEFSEWQAFCALDQYEAQFKQERMSADERSTAILNTIFGGPDKWQKR